MNCIIANKYEIIEEVGQGTFGKVFRGKHIRTKEDVAIKIQFKSIINVLQHEAKLYKHLENTIGIPSMRNYGHQEGFHYLILDYLDKPLDKLEMTPSESLTYFIEAVKVLETIHKLGVLHRDIKPDNLMINERKQVYVIDFGLSKWFLDSSGNHMKEKTNKSMVGTIKYSSINVHNGIEPSRRDDLESLCYTFMSLYGKELMWANVCEELKPIDETDETDETDEQKKKKLVCEKIKALKLDDALFSDLPDEFLTIVFYVRNLSFEETPNYKYIINVLHNVVNTGSDSLEITRNEF